MQSDHGFSHVDDQGRAKMVDVGEKPKTARAARAETVLVMRAETLAAIKDGAIAKGAGLGVARTAGLMAAKKTAELIPLCHRRDHRDRDRLRLHGRDDATTAAVRVIDRTGAEMEALTAASIAALTVYDMCKAVDRGMEIRSTVLIAKSGWKRASGAGPAAERGARPMHLLFLPVNGVSAPFGRACPRIAPTDPPRWGRGFRAAERDRRGGARLNVHRDPVLMGPAPGIRTRRDRPPSSALTR